MNCPETIQMITNLVVAIASCIAIYALFFHRSAVVLQKRQLQASLFNGITARINELEDQWYKCKTDSEKTDWYNRLLPAFEYFAFYANRGYLTADMTEYYISGIVECCDRLKGYPVLLEKYQKMPADQMNELVKFYKKVTGKESPFI